MRRLLPLCGGFLACASTLAAQECAVPQPYCPPQACAPRPAAAPAAAAAPVPLALIERFIRGPAPGTATGESNSIGIRGPALHIPEMRIALPHLELPSLYQIRHDATKIFDTTRSPLVGDAALELDNVGAAPAAAPAEAAPAAAPAYCPPYCPPACAAPMQCTSLEDQLKQLNQRLARLDALERELAAMKQQQVNSSAWENSKAIPQVEDARPSFAARQTAASPASRPLVRSRPQPLQPASYEEASAEPEIVTPTVRPTSRKPTSAPVAKQPRAQVTDETLQSNFGMWSTTKR